jgi:hypothetical protein
MSHLTNAQIFKAIGLDDSVNPSSKYTLLICAHVLMDWKAWSGHISADQLALATNQSSRGVQRHLKTLVEAGWLFRHAEVRGPGLHHKSFTILNQDKVREVLKRAHDTTELVKPDTTDLVSVSPKVSSTSWSTDTTELVKPDTTELADAKNDTPDTTELVKPDTTELVRTAMIETELTKSVVVDTTELASTTTELVSDLPNLSYISIYSNNTQSSLNTEAEQEPEAREESSEVYWEFERGSIWCDRCKQHVPNDQPHTYPHSKLICSDQEPTDQTLEKAWDDAWSKHELEPITEELRDGLWYVSRIDDRLAYRQEVHRQVKHHKRYDVRDALLIGDELFNKMTQELIAPQSAIDWVTLQASGHLPSISTPAAPPKESNVYTVTIEQQQRMKEIDRAWATGADHTTKATNGW